MDVLDPSISIPPRGFAKIGDCVGSVIRIETDMGSKSERSYVLTNTRVNRGTAS